MKSYRIDRIDLDSGWREQVAAVVSDAFSMTPAEAIAAISLTTATSGSQPSAYFAAVENDEVIGFNAFIAHDLRFEDRSVLAFQSCWTATSSAHRGKKVFQNIILEAHRVLAAEGASYVIGWPNPSSEPLFVNKLGYCREASVKRNIPGLFAEWFFLSTGLVAQGITQNDEQLIELKSRRHADKLHVVREGNSILWGVVRVKSTKLGQIPYFAVGGIRWSTEGKARRLAKAMRKQLPFVAFWQIISEHRNSINPAIGAFSPSSTNPMIWYPLRADAQGPFDFFAGIRDVY